MGIRSKLLLIFAGVIVVVVGVHTYLQLTLQNLAFSEELQKRGYLMQENLHQRALLQAETLERVVAEDIASYNFYALSLKLQEAVGNRKNLEYIKVLDNNATVYVNTAKNQLPDEAGPLPALVLLPGESLPEKLAQASRSYARVEYQWPIHLGDALWGELQLVYSLETLNEALYQAKVRSEEKLGSLARTTFYIAVSLLVVALAFVSHLSRRMIAPILHLTDKTHALADGDFEVARELQVNSDDELGKLTQHFIDMAARLESTYGQLAEYSQTLEHRVGERTRELHEKNVALQDAMHNLEESQQQLIHSEKMAALGQLIAGIAHEINTPLGAIQASVGNTSKNLEHFCSALPTFLEQASPALRDLFSTLIQQARVSNRLSTREERQLRRQVSDQLQEAGIPATGELADMLVDMQLYEQVETFLPALQEPDAQRCVALAHRLTGVGRQSETIRTAIGRASKVVFALKHFTHHDHSGNAIQTDVNDGIRTVLVLYHNLLKQGCELVEDYGDLPEIQAYPDELNQVWTNLIHNALYAMQYQGVIEVHTGLDADGWVSVRICDNGAGIPEPIQSKIYDSFFTTKPAGEGSGLGLGICKRIVDKHGGQISFESRPGHTCFTVRLPLEVPEA